MTMATCNALDAAPDIGSLCDEVLAAGCVDPMTLRFRVVEFDKADGTMLGVPFDNLGFPDAIEQTAGLLRTHSDSHFCLQPCGYVQ